MDDQTFEQRFLLHVDPLSADEAWAALDAALGVLGEALDGHAARTVADALPGRLAVILARGKGPQDLSLVDVDRHLTRALGLPEGRAREHAQVVLAAFSHVIEPTVLGRLKRELGEPLDSLLAAPPHHEDAPPPAGHEHTLAAGRPGGGHPLSEARPDAGQTHSVANPNPHGDTKLSSSEGATQEREGETLAEGGRTGR